MSPSYKNRKFNVSEGEVYHIKERCLETALRWGVTVSSNSRRTYPAYCCRVDSQKALFWMVPMSRNILKYKILRDREMERYGNDRSFVFGQYDGGEAVFLMKSLFPVTREYILHPHTRKGESVPVAWSMRQEIIRKFDLTFQIAQKGIPCALTDIVKIEKLLL